MRNLLKVIQYDMLDFIEGDDENETDYTAKDVTLCITSLLEFMSSMESEVQTVESAKGHIEKVVLSLNSLNHQCGDCLIETEQREDICQFIQKVISAANVEFAGDVTEEWREW
ncbi:hypothetical protein ESZ36_01095 [Colwellia demingiae]|uniref:Uncharacterized protein n=1 Tax=Colwellia demingiae TaxID=89401 RepID=A0A5C6QTG4_9GAMM|nr:hypothetical protein [Colwellia demingiae]TWX71858.1 hypothetical protein ESZ36_01095 [Colwellia demingiae]